MQHQIERPEVRWITTQSELEKVVEQWLLKPVIYLDTEFHRETTFYPKLALIQVYDGEQVYFIEPEICLPQSALAALIASNEVIKVFHSSSEDCEVLFRVFNVAIGKLWDTQIAAAYLNQGSHIGYGNLVSSVCDVHLEKGFSRSDWLKRPLSNKQIQYAIDDVLYLDRVYHAQKLAFDSEPQKLDWFWQECSATSSKVFELDNIEQAYLNVKNGWRLTEEQLGRLYSLSYWREIQSREKDKPRKFIVDDEVLIGLAKLGLQKGDQLPKVEGWHPAAKRKYAQQLMDVIIEHNEQPFDKVLEVPLSPAFWKNYTPIMQKARDMIHNRAALHKMEPEVFCSKKLLRGYVKHLLKKSNRPLAWTDWRDELLAKSLNDMFCP